MNLSGSARTRTGLVVCGHPHYDYVLNLSRTWTAEDREQMRERLLPGLLKHQRVVVFLSEGSERLSAVVVSYRHRSNTPCRVGEAARAERRSS